MKGKSPTLFYRFSARPANAHSATQGNTGNSRESSAMPRISAGTTTAYSINKWKHKM